MTGKPTAKALRILNIAPKRRIWIANKEVADRPSVNRCILAQGRIHSIQVVRVIGCP